MQNWEKGKFEDEWKKAFEGAELVPSENVWDSIDAKLLNGENSELGFEQGFKNAFQGATLKPSEDVWKAIDVSLVQAESVQMKKRVIFYQRLAAASAGIMVMFAAYSWISPRWSVQEYLGNNNPAKENQNLNQDSTRIHEQNSGGKENSLSTERNSTDNSMVSEKLLSGQSGANDQNVIKNSNHSSNLKKGKENFRSNPVSNNRSMDQPLIGTDFNNGKTFRFKQAPISELELAEVSSLPDFFAPNDYSIAYRIADALPAQTKQKKSSTVADSKWAAVSFSAGSFSPRNNNNAMLESTMPNAVFMDLKSSNTSTIKTESARPGSSMSMAVSVGKRIFKRFIVHGGLSYLSQTASSQNEIVEVAPANQVFSAAFLAPETMNTVTYGTTQEINSTFQFISVPVQVGYMIVDRKFGIQVNGGVSPDFFLRNSVYNETTQVETINSSGENGAFKTVSLSGLGSLEFSYKFLTHYRLSLVPGVRYSLTSIYNENSAASAQPFVADLGLRFRYIF